MTPLPWLLDALARAAAFTLEALTDAADLPPPTPPDLRWRDALPFVAEDIQ